MSEVQAAYEIGAVAGGVDGQWKRAAGEWLANLKAERTKKAYLYAWRRFLAFAEVRPRDVTRSLVIGYRNELKEAEYAPATIALHLSAISSFFRHVVEAGLIEMNPVQGVKWPGVEPYAHVKAGVAKLAADDGDLALLASIDTTTETGRRDRAIILLLLAHGLRVGELAQLYVAVLDGTFLKVKRKGAEQKTAVLLAAEAKVAIEGYLDGRGELAPDSPLFVASEKGKAAAAQLHGVYEERPLSARAIRAMLTRRCNPVFGRGHGITPHTLRHALATRADQEGAALGDISAMLGHKSTRIRPQMHPHLRLR